MRSLLGTRSSSVYFAALLMFVLVIASTTTVDARKPPKPSPTPSPTPTAPPSGGGSATVVIAASGTLEPSGEYLNVDVTATCPVGWTSKLGSLNVRQVNPGGAGTFSVACTGTPQGVRRG